MQFSAFALAALGFGSALATTGVTVHVVTVGSTNGSLVYAPNNLKAAVGDMVQFQFAPNNHTVTQSTFDSPCQPIAMHTNITGVYSGFMPVKSTDMTVPTYTIMIKNTNPMWMYCSQGKHCQNGMVMVINENTAANATRSLENYKTGAKAAPVNLAPGAVAPGNSTLPSFAPPANPPVPSLAPPIAVAPSPTAGTAASTTSGTVLSTGAASSLKIGTGLGGMVALVAGLLL